jgi:DNA-binding NarL/FixJ family response regulator
MLRAGGELQLDLLNLAAARAALEEGLALAKKIRSDFWTVSLSSALARVLVALGETDAASSLLQPFDETRPLVLTAWHSGSAEVEVLLARREYDRALRLANLLEAAAWPDGRPSRLTLHRVEALLGLQRPDDALAAVDRALAVGERLPGSLRWRMDVIQGRTMTVLGRRSDAMRAYRGARQAIDSLAAGISDDEVREGFVARAAALLPQSRPEAAKRAEAREQFGGLTEREREVAALIGLGRSNREIAQSLYLSERTVAVHVANTLAKLGFSSRSQIAVWAAARGLSSAPDAS